LLGFAVNKIDFKKMKNKKIDTNERKNKMMMPTFDGHFWVEKDGQIMDFDFSDDDEYIRVANNTTKEKKYHEAPEIVQKIFIGMVEKSLSFELQKMKIIKKSRYMCFNYEDLVEKASKSDDKKELEEFKPQFECCYLNAYKNWKENGGRLVFGSQGYVKKDGSVWWEYGNPGWKTVKKFTK